MLTKRMKKRRRNESDGTISFCQRFFFFDFCLGFKDWAEKETGPLQHHTPTNVSHWLISNNCLKEAKFLKFIATNNPMWRALEVDTCLFLLLVGLHLCSFKNRTIVL
jgi:hypothetical protein